MVGRILLAGLALAALAQDRAAVDAATWRVPLQPTLSSRAHAGVGAHGSHASVWQPAFPRHNAHADAAPVPVDMSLDTFTATLYFGTPPQPVSVMLSIQGAEAYVLNHAVGHHTFYDHTKSSTYQPNGTRVKIDPGSPFEFDGFLSRDHVSIGGPHATERIDVPDHLLVEIDASDDSFVSLGANMSGMICLGLGRSRVTGAPSLARAMVDRGLLERPEVGVSFSKHDAHVLFGGIDAAYKRSDIHYFSLDSQMWSAPISGMSVEGKELVGATGNTYLGHLPFIMGPKKAVEALAKAVGAKNHDIPCDGPAPDIVLHLGQDLDVTLTKQDYIVEMRPGVCRFLFFASNVDMWLLGMPFLQRVYTVLEYGKSEGHGRIGFAKLKMRG